MAAKTYDDFQAEALDIIKAREARENASPKEESIHIDTFVNALKKGYSDDATDGSKKLRSQARLIVDPWTPN